MFVDKIRLHGNLYFLFGNLKVGGSIATEEQYINQIDSYAFLNPNGNIWRYGQIIGTRDDIEMLNIKANIEV